MVNRPDPDAILPPVSAEDEATVDALLAKAREGVGKRPIGGRPDLDAIRAEHCNPNLIDAGARKDVRELLAYVADLEERCRAYEAMRSDIARAIDTWKQEEVSDET